MAIGGLITAPAASRGHGAAVAIAAEQVPDPRAAGGWIGDPDEQVRRDGQMAVAAGDEPLDVTAGASPRSGDVAVITHPMSPAVAASARESLAMLRTVSRRIGAEEHLGRHLVGAQEPLERRQVTRAVRRIADSGLPDRVEARQDHLRELVDVALPRAVVVAHHHQPPAVVDHQPAHEVDRADADERAWRREALRVRIDRRHHGAHAVALAVADDGDERQLVLRDDILAKSRDADRTGPRRRARAAPGAAQASMADAAERRAARRKRVAGQPVHETEDRIAVEAREDAERRLGRRRRTRAARP